MTLLSLASRQIWPQVLAVLELKPHRAILFHSAEGSESRRPAERLLELFRTTNLVPGGVRLVEAPHDDFGKLMQAMAEVAEAELLDGANCRFNLTGGNKLMAMAAAEWSRLNGVCCFYLERDLRNFPFLPVGSDLQPQPGFSLNPHLARDLDPLALLRCQLQAAEIVGEGERLTLSDTGRTLNESSLRLDLLRGNAPDPRAWLNRRSSVPLPDGRAGDDLELLTAAVILHLGVPMVQRGIRLKSGAGRSHWQDEGELDLVFNWCGKLWVVDCKHRRTAESRIGQLRRRLESTGPLDPEMSGLLEQITNELRDKELKPLKEDLLNTAEVGGLLGKAVAVRVTPLPDEAGAFALSRGLPVILRKDLCDGWRALLHPNQPASLESLRALATARTRAG
jgi:hypothetical protein